MQAWMVRHRLRYLYLRFKVIISCHPQSTVVELYIIVFSTILTQYFSAAFNLNVTHKGWLTSEVKMFEFVVIFNPLLEEQSIMHHSLK